MYKIKYTGYKEKPIILKYSKQKLNKFSCDIVIHELLYYIKYNI